MLNFYVAEKVTQKLRILLIKLRKKYLQCDLRSQMNQGDGRPPHTKISLRYFLYPAKSLRHWLIPSRNIDGQAFLQFTRWLKGKLYLSPFWGRSNEYQNLLGTYWQKVNCLSGSVGLRQFNRIHKNGLKGFFKRSNWMRVFCSITFKAKSCQLCGFDRKQRIVRFFILGYSKKI